MIREIERDAKARVNRVGSECASLDISAISIAIPAILSRIRSRIDLNGNISAFIGISSSWKALLPLPPPFLLPSCLTECGGTSKLIFSARPENRRASTQNPISHVPYSLSQELRYTTIHRFRARAAHRRVRMCTRAFFFRAPVIRARVGMEREFGSYIHDGMFFGRDASRTHAHAYTCYICCFRKSASILLAIVMSMKKFER